MGNDLTTCCMCPDKAVMKKRWQLTSKEADELGKTKLTKPGACHVIYYAMCSAHSHFAYERAIIDMLKERHRESRIAPARLVDSIRQQR